MRGGWLVLVATVGCGQGEPELDCSPEYQIVSYVDADGDGAGDDATEEPVCELSGNRISLGGDCDDSDATISPKAVELCDGVDQDCDTEIDDGLSSDTWYLDEDDDNFGDAEKPVTACAQPGGATKDTSDCDDDRADVYPGAAEVCDGVDNNCNGATDSDDPNLDLSSTDSFFPDEDGDGYGSAMQAVQACENPNPGLLIEAGGDCDDTRAGINPGALETCDNRDNDCDGLTDDADPSVDPADLITVYADVDSDGLGNLYAPEQACDPSGGFVANGDDCDDSDPAVREPSDWALDDDNDGYGDNGSVVVDCFAPADHVAAGGPNDCNDANGAVNPGETEVCNGVDDDCDALAEDADPSLDVATAGLYHPDSDNDGFGNSAVDWYRCTPPANGTTDDQDCDDTRSTVNPTALEVCDLVDNDCDGLTDDNDPSVDPGTLITLYEDLDRDGVGNELAPIELCDAEPGYVAVTGDCDDENALITGPTLWVLDGDGDGWGQGAVVSPTPSCTEPFPGTAPQPPEDDCDDVDPDINPDAIDVCEDLIDQDCSGTDASCSQPSCQAYLDADPTLPSGVYEVEPSPGVFFDVYCDMTTDGGGWTLVMSSGAAGLPSDGKGPYHAEMTTMFPVSAHINPWDGMKPAVEASHDIRFACRTSPVGGLVVDLSFYDVDWYDQITNGNEASACFYTGGVVGVAPQRKNNVTGQLLALGNAYNSGSFEGEDSCGDAGDFTVDFDDRGMDSNQADGTDWGSDDSSNKCGTIAGNQFFILVR